jgi:succinate dehydrogenase/fumarate reductase flavoprotein subunit
MDNPNFLKHTIAIRDEQGSPQLSYRPVTIEDIQPLEEIKY